MNIRNIFKFNSSSSISENHSRTKAMRKSPVDVLKKAVVGAIAQITERPINGEVNSTEYIAPYYPYPLRTLYDVSDYCDIISGCKGALRREIFRKGFEVMPAEEADTEDTDSEEEADSEDVSENQESTSIQDMQAMKDEKKKKSEDKKRKQIIEKLEKINTNNQTVIEVLKELEDDINILDICYLFTPHDYDLNKKTGEITTKIMTEALRVSPINMGLIMNEADEYARDNDGNWMMCAVNNRTTLNKIKNTPLKEGETFPEAYDNRGQKLYPVFYCQLYGGTKYHYFEWEMMHSSRYKPGKRTGFSPVITCWQKARTLFFQDKYLWELYEGKRPPKGMLVFNTPNQESVSAAWDDMVQRAQENPHFVPVMAMPSAFGGESNGGKIVEFIDFMKNLNDLSFVEQRDQHRREIGFVYGVSPILINDTSSGGGLNNEGMQYTVTNRAVEEGQSFHNSRHLKRINDLMGNEGWLIKLRPSEEQDEMAKLERIEKSLAIASSAVGLGLEVVWNEKTGEAVIKGGTVQPPAQESQGFGGGLPGGGAENKFEPLPSSDEQSGKPENSDVAKAKVYLKQGEKAPQGVTVQHGEKGGSFYESGASPSREKETIGEYDADSIDDPSKNPLHPDALTPEQRARWGQCEVKAKEFAKKTGGKVYSAGGHAVALTPDGIVFDYVLDFKGPLEDYEKLVPYIFTKQKENVEKSFDFEEVIKGLDTRKNFSQLAVVLKEEIDKFIRLYKRKPTREDIEKRLEKMRINMKMELGNASKEFIREQYENTMRNLSKDLRVNLFLDHRDQEAIAVLSGQKVLSDSFDKITNKASQKIREAIIKSYNNPDGIDMAELNETIRKVGNIADFHAETIARTETSKVSSAARRNTYKKVDPSNQYRYKHIGPNDFRSTECCKTLVAQTKEGVSWDDYVDTMKEVSAKYFPEWSVDESAPVAHYNCRHSFVRVQ